MTPPVELTDITSVRQFMQKSTSDSIQDPDLEVLILQASEAIERHCNRQFVREGEGLRTFELLPNGNGVETLDLKPYEFRAIQKVVLDADLVAGGVLLAAAHYRVWPLTSRDGTYFGLRFAELPEPPSVAALPAAGALPFQTRRVDVTAEWGMTDVPDDVQKACNVTVESWCRLRRDGGMPLNVETDEKSTMQGWDLPPSAFFALRRWVRPTPSA